MSTKYGGLVEIEFRGDTTTLTMDGQHGISSIEVTPRDGIIVRQRDGSVAEAESIDIRDDTREVTIHGMSSFF